MSPFEQTQLRTNPALNDTRVDKTVPTYEYTFGGPAVKDKLWFFTSGRAQTQESARALVQTLIPYTYSVDSKRFELNGTYSMSAGHRFQGVLIQSHETQTNASQNPATILDLNSLFDANRAMNLFTVNYSGIVSPRLFIEARASVRNETIKDVGGRSTDIIDGTLLVTRNQRRFWAPTFCGVCDDEQRDGKDVFVKASYFLSTKELGSHDMVVGYDGYNDQRFANNHQSASDYRILGVNQIVRGTDVYAQFLADGNTQIAWQPIFLGTEGTNFRTHSLFYNDNWRVNSRLTANLGLRYDRNQGANGAGEVVTRDWALSPRIGMVVDPFGDQKWTVTGSVAKYVAGIASSVADVSSPGGNFDAYVYPYLGPAINANQNGALIGTREALTQLFQWFDQNRNTLPLVGTTVVRGLTPQIRESLERRTRGSTRAASAGRSVSAPASEPTSPTGSTAGSTRSARTARPGKSPTTGPMPCRRSKAARTISRSSKTRMRSSGGIPA